jgi:hypothetical protein
VSGAEGIGNGKGLRGALPTCLKVTRLLAVRRPLLTCQPDFANCKVGKETRSAPTLADLPTQPDQPDADFVAMDAWLTEWASDPPPANAPTDQLTKPVPRLSSLPDGIACQCGGRLRAVGREYLCDHCQRPLPAVCGRCYRVLFVGAEGRAMCKTCQVAYAFKDGHWREVSRRAKTKR